MGLKRVYVARRNPAIDAAAFPARWAAHHRLGQRFPELVRNYPRARYALVQRGAGIAGLSEQHDAVGMLWLRDAAALTAVVQDPAAIPTMRADELRVFTAPVFAAALAVEDPLDALPREEFCLLSLPRRRRDVPPDEFAAIWRAAIDRLPGARQCRLLQPPSFPCDGLAEVWFDSLEAAQAAGASAAYAALLAAEARIAQPDPVRLLTRTSYAWAAGENFLPAVLPPSTTNSPPVQ